MATVANSRAAAEDAERRHTEANEIKQDLSLKLQKTVSGPHEATGCKRDAAQIKAGVCFWKPGTWRQRRADASLRLSYKDFNHVQGTSLAFYSDSVGAGFFLRHMLLETHPQRCNVWTPRGFLIYSAGAGGEGAAISVFVIDFSRRDCWIVSPKLWIYTIRTHQHFVKQLLLYSRCWCVWRRTRKE